jgi:aminoglycoside phosphotransferase (APT) family kinase protein
VAEHTPTPAEDTRPDPLRVVTLVLVATMTLSVLGMIFYLVTYVRGQRELTECNSHAFQELNSSLAVSREAARQDRAELRTLVTSLTDPEKSAAQRKDALDVFVAALNGADQDRADAPLPSRTCG